MRILVLGDLHYPREGKLLVRLLNEIKKNNYDYIFICGDLVNYGNKNLLTKLLSLIHKNSSAKVVAVMGNHDFWLSNKEFKQRKSSWDNISKYKHVFREFKDILLWDTPYIIGDWGIAGVPGWYDFSFVNHSLKVPMKFYLEGILPHSFEVWNDPRMTNFGESPEKITEKNVKMLHEQLSQLKRKGIKKVIVLLHFVPLKEFIKYTNELKFDFWNAFYGSTVLGDTILKFKDVVKRVYFGHISHKFLKAKVLTVENIHFEVVDISENSSDPMSVATVLKI
ncbi:MAG: metallophosphoesterase [Candidatus Odinarchaeota archaeon]|nr:metallophosphoesterase [Candidatus Odinarchaeota archaeon]